MGSRLFRQLVALCNKLNFAMVLWLWVLRDMKASQVSVYKADVPPKCMIATAPHTPVLLAYMFCLAMGQNVTQRTFWPIARQNMQANKTDDQDLQKGHMLFSKLNKYSVQVLRGTCRLETAVVTMLSLTAPTATTAKAGARAAACVL